MKKNLRLFFLVIALLLFSGFSTTTSYAAKIYFTNFGQGHLQKANLDGTSVTTIETTINSYIGLEVDDTNNLVYFSSNSNTVYTVNPDGSNLQTFITNAAFSNIQSIAVDNSAGKVYFSDFIQNKIFRANDDGTNLEEIMSGLSGVQSIGLDTAAGKIYFTELNSNDIHRANLDGSGVETLLTVSAPRQIDLDLTNNKMYIASDGSNSIVRANLDGTGLETLVTGVSGAYGVALDLQNSQFFYSNYSNSTLNKANLDGSGSQTIFTGSGQIFELSLSAVPEPTSLMLLGSALLGWLPFRRKK